jgi:uncharacterized membrane protein YozB (DUF420 family)
MCAVAGTPASARAIVNRRREHAFYIAMALVMSFIVLIGFARSFFLAFLWCEHDPHASSETVYYVHGTFAATWIAVALIQPVLIRSRRVTSHRQFGWVGAAIACAVVVTGILVVILSAARPPGSVLPATPLDLMGVLISGIMMFGLLVGLAIASRRDGASHKRLMCLATINLLQAAIVRIPLGFLYDAGPVTTFLLAFVFIGRCSSGILPPCEGFTRQRYGVAWE